MSSASKPFNSMDWIPNASTDSFKRLPYTEDIDTNKNDKLIANISKLRSIGYKYEIDKINEKNFNI